MSMTLTVLGSSAATPSPKRNPSSVILNVENSSYMFDCGEGTQMQIMKYNISKSRIDRIFISHLHGDHYLGLIGLIFSYHLFGREKPLYIYGPKPLKKIIELQIKASEAKLRYDLIFIPTKDKTKTKIYEDEKIEIISFPLQHKIPTTGFLFKEKEKPLNIDPLFVKQENPSYFDIKNIKAGKDYIKSDGTMIPNKEITCRSTKPNSFAYCCDTLYDSGIIQIIQGVDLLYHESTFCSDLTAIAAERMHTTAAQAASIAAQACVGKLILGHISMRYKNSEELLKEAIPIFKNTIIAEDGLKVNI